MPKLFYLSEIIKFAIVKEKESYHLYKKLADFTEKQSIKEVFCQLMREEKQHEEFYKNMLKAVPKEQTAGVKEDEEYYAYVQELISASRSVQPLSIESNTGLSKILNYAIAREKDSILFYTGLKNYVSSTNQDQINKIIKEETKHAAKLLALKKESKP